MGTVVQREQCPRCAAEGRDNSGDNLARYADGGGLCHACGYVDRAKVSRAKSEGQTKGTLAIDDVLSYPVGCDSSRALSADVVNDFGIRVSYNEEDGKVERAYYVYRNQDGEAIGYKRRILKDKKFVVGGKLDLYGKHLCTGKTSLVIVEGEEDAHAVTEMLRHIKPAIGTADVVSIPNGAKVKQDGKPVPIDPALKDNLEWLSTYKRVILALDSDQPGRDTTEAIAEWLCPVVEVRTVEHNPALGKDASDYLVKGHGKAWRDALGKAKIYEPDGIVDGTDISLDDILEPIPEGTPYPWPIMQDMMKGMRKGEILTICAGSGIGKSTILRELVKVLIEEGHSVANIALEDQMNVAAQALVALDMNIPLHRFRFHPPPRHEVEPHLKKMVGNGRTHFYKHFGGLTCDTLIQKLRYYIKRKGVDFIALDHLSMVMSNSQSRDERKDIDKLMTELAKLVTETGVGLLQIVHLKRKGGGPGAQSFAKGGEVELTDLRGSAALEQLSWAVLGAERDQQGESADFVQLRILKNRTVGFVGLADKLRYDHGTGRLNVVGLSEPPDLEDIDEIIAGDE